jgi:GR25 family glycosyltransferase involved in LPS biosynthesis
MTLLEYFDRISIIHLPQREDRYRALAKELQRLEAAITDPKVAIPDAPMPTDAYGFTNKGVYGNYLSHLEILKSAQRDKLQSVWILEDDAIFSHRFVRDQAKIAGFLASNEWDICFFGHSLTKELDSLPRGLPRYSGPFYWAHCYAVHSRILPRLIDYMEDNLMRPGGHPLGGKAYIDAAFTLFRKFNPDVVALVANPVMSVQRGSRSSLHNRRWYDRLVMIQPVIYAARAMRDEFWRWTGLTFGGAAPKDLRNGRGP